jgi:hypothetical protein
MSSLNALDGELLSVMRKRFWRSRRTGGEGKDQCRSHVPKAISPAQNACLGVRAKPTLRRMMAGQSMPGTADALLNSCRLGRDVAAQQEKIAKRQSVGHLSGSRCAKSRMKPSSTS